MQIYPQERKAPFWIVFGVAVVAVALSGVTLYAIYLAVCGQQPLLLYVAIALWAVGPPTWFWLEYFSVYMRWGKPDAFELFKYGQHLAGTIWAGILATLLVLAASGIIDPDEEGRSAERCSGLCPQPWLSCLASETEQ